MADPAPNSLSAATDGDVLTETDLMNDPEYRLYAGLPVSPTEAWLLEPLGPSLVPDISQLVEQARQLLKRRRIAEAVMIASVSIDQVTAEASEGSDVPIAGANRSEHMAPGDLLLQVLQDDPGLEAALSLVGVTKARPSECLAAVAWWCARAAHTVTQLSSTRTTLNQSTPAAVSANLAKNVMEASLRLSLQQALWASRALAQAQWCDRLEALLPEEMVTAVDADFTTGLRRLLDHHAVSTRSVQTAKAVRTRHNTKTLPLRAMVLARYERKYRAHDKKGDRADIARWLSSYYGQPGSETIAGYIKMYTEEPTLSAEQAAVRAWLVQEVSSRPFVSEQEVQTFAQNMAANLAARVPATLKNAVSGDSADYYSAYRLLLWALIAYPKDLTPPPKPTASVGGPPP